MPAQIEFEGVLGLNNMYIFSVFFLIKECCCCDAVPGLQLHDLPLFEAGQTYYVDLNYYWCRPCCRSPLYSACCPFPLHIQDNERTARDHILQCEWNLVNVFFAKEYDVFHTKVTGNQAFTIYPAPKHEHGLWHDLGSLLPGDMGRLEDSDTQPGHICDTQRLRDHMAAITVGRQNRFYARGRSRATGLAAVFVYANKLRIAGQDETWHEPSANDRGGNYTTTTM